MKLRDLIISKNIVINVPLVDDMYIAFEKDSFKSNEKAPAQPTLKWYFYSTLDVEVNEIEDPFQEIKDTNDLWSTKKGDRSKYERVAELVKSLYKAFELIEKDL